MPQFRVAVVTPYYKEDLETLHECHRSVRDQTFACAHFLVADGFPKEQVSSWNVAHFRLPFAHGDAGNVARCTGAMSAGMQGFDAVAFLDADNWYHPQHIEKMVELHERTGAAVCTSERSIHRLDGSLLPTGDENNGSTFVDTSCMFFTRPAFGIHAVWGLMPKALAPICDQVVWAAVRQRNVARAHLADKTVAFRSQYARHYAMAGEEPPPGAKPRDCNAAAYSYWRSLTEAEQRKILNP